MAAGTRQAIAASRRILRARRQNGIDWWRRSDRAEGIGEALRRDLKGR